jgi:hypothetical protein
MQMTVDMENRRFPKVAEASDAPRRFKTFQKIAAAGAEGMRCRNDFAFYCAIDR